MIFLSTAVGQVVACASVTQRALVRTPVGTSFLGEIFFRGFCSTVRQMLGCFRPPWSPNIIWPSLSSSIVIHSGRQWPEMLTRPKASNTHIHDRLSLLCILDLENGKHTKFKLNWSISFKDINFFINCNMKISNFSMRIRFWGKTLKNISVHVSGCVK